MSQAETRVPPVGIPVDYPTTGQAGGVFSVVMGVVVAILWLRRRMSHDGLEVTKDRAEGSLMQTLQREREEALKTAAEAWARRTEDAKAISSLTAKVENLNKENESMGKHIQELEKQVKMLRRIVAKVAPAEMGRLFGD